MRLRQRASVDYTEPPLGTPQATVDEQAHAQSQKKAARTKRESRAKMQETSPVMEVTAEEEADDGHSDGGNGRNGGDAEDVQTPVQARRRTTTAGRRSSAVTASAKPRAKSTAGRAGKGRTQEEEEPEPADAPVVPERKDDAPASRGQKRSPSPAAAASTTTPLRKSSRTAKTADSMPFVSPVLKFNKQQELSKLAGIIKGVGAAPASAAGTTTTNSATTGSADDEFDGNYAALLSAHKSLQQKYAALTSVVEQDKRALEAAEARWTTKAQAYDDLKVKLEKRLSQASMASPPRTRQSTDTKEVDTNLQSPEQQSAVAALTEEMDELRAIYKEFTALHVTIDESDANLSHCVVLNQAGKKAVKFDLERQDSQMMYMPISNVHFLPVDLQGPCTFESKMVPMFISKVVEALFS